MHRSFAALALAATLALAIACTTPPPSPATAPAAASGAVAPTAASAAPTAAPKVALAAEVSLGIGSLVDGIEPHSTSSQASSIPLEQVFDGLTGLDAAGKMIPALAESWRPLSPTVWEFSLRSNVRFQNGELMTPADVKFTVDRILNPAAALTLTSRLTTIAGVDVVDERTVRVRTKDPDPLLPARMNLAKVVPARAFQAVDLDTFVRNPIGTGAWKVKEVRQGSFISFEAFPQSWRGAPLMTAARIVRIPEPATLAAASRNGEVDIAYELPADAEASVVAGGQTDIKIIERLSTIIVDLNSFPTNGGIAPFADKRVRQAMNYAVDKEALNRAIEGGYARVAQGQLVTPGTVGFNPNLRPYPYDMTRAQALMREAGQAGGFSAAVLVTPGVNATTAIALGGFLRTLNVNITIDQVDLPVFLQRNTSGQRGPMFLWGPGFSNFIDADQSLSFFQSTVPPPSRRFENPQFDTLMQQSKTELDAARRDRLLQDAAAVLREEVPFIFLFQRGVLLGVNKKVKGLELRVDNGILFDKLTRER